MTSSQYADEVIAALQEMDEIERAIWIAGVQALTTKAFTFPEFEAWTHDRFRRHRNGEELLPSDLETPDAPPSGLH